MIGSWIDWATTHYENMPMQYTEMFKVVKMKIFSSKNFNIFLIFAENIDCGYTLEPPPRGIPLHTSVLLYKSGFKGVYITRTCFPDDSMKQ